MKKVEAVDILGTPNRIDRQVACPGCSARAMAFEDGSVVCIAEGGVSFAPEAGDGELFDIRRAFDARNGITASDRLLIPARLRQSLADARSDRR